MNIHGHIIDFIVAIALMFIVTLLYFGQKQDTLVQTLVSTETESLVNEIRSQGYLTRERYDGYLEDLSHTGMLYEVSLEHRQSINEPEYRFRTAEEVITEQDTAFTGSNVYTFWPVSTIIPVVTDPVSSGSLNTETNASVLASALNTPTSPSHVHTDACYNGTKHVHTGNSSSGGDCYGTYEAHSHFPSCYTTSYCSGTWTGGWVTQYTARQICSFCGVDSGGSAITTTASGQPAPWQWTCSSCRKRNSTSFGGGTIVGDWTGNCTGCPYGISSSMSMQGVTHGTESTLNCSLTGSYALNCGKTAGLYYNGNTLVYPICNQNVTSITPTHNLQTVAIGDPLITTITANYQDGSTKILVGTTTFSTANVVQNQTVALTYSYTLNAIVYTKTCNITVSVIPRSKNCVNGHTYNLNSNGSDPGCPYCHAWLSSLTIVNPATGSITIYKGTTLPGNGVTLLATYLDGTTQYLYTEYLDNLDNQFVGTQNVTMSYKGKYVSLTVKTKRNLTLCGVCGRYYELYPDGSDPGCPWCQSRTPIFTGNVLAYFDKNYTNEILKELYEGSGTYYFTNNDYILFNVVNRRASWGTRLLASFHPNLGESNIRTSSGGYVRENGS